MNNSMEFFLFLTWFWIFVLIFVQKSNDRRASIRPSAGEVKKKVALVGKGLTFDSGGYNIKVR